MTDEVIITAFEEIKAEILALREQLDKTPQSGAGVDIERLNQRHKQLIERLNLINKNIETATLATAKVVGQRLEEVGKTMVMIAEKMGDLNQAIIKQKEHTNPKPQEVIHSVDFSSRGVIIGTMASALIALTMTFWSMGLSQKNERLEPNDLKYRTIRMYGGATPKDIANLEELFRTASPKDLRTLRKKVETYEEAVRKQAEAIEQSRLAEQEAARLDEQAKELKNR